MQSAGVILGTAVVAYSLMAAVQFLRRLKHSRAESQRTLDLLKKRYVSLQLLNQRNTLASAQILKQAAGPSNWQGFRDFVIDQKVWESESVCSFDLVPRDRRPLPEFGTGQILSVRLAVPEETHPAICRYTISGPPNAGFYRITVTQDPKDAASLILHDRIEEGAVLGVTAPRGQIGSVEYEEHRRVFITAGVGLDRFLKLANVIDEACLSAETILFNSVRNGRDHANKTVLKRLINRNPNLRVVTAYSAPEATERLGVDFDIRGDLSVAKIKPLLGSNDYEFCLCSSPEMMRLLASELLDWGVPQERIFMEGITGVPVQTSYREPPETARATAAYEAVDSSITTWKPNIRSEQTETSNATSGERRSSGPQNGVFEESRSNSGVFGTRQTPRQDRSFPSVAPVEDLTEVHENPPRIAIPAGETMPEA